MVVHDLECISADAVNLHVRVLHIRVLPFVLLKELVINVAMCTAVDGALACAAYSVNAMLAAQPVANQTDPPSCRQGARVLQACCAGAGYKMMRGSSICHSSLSTKHHLQIQDTQ